MRLGIITFAIVLYATECYPQHSVQPLGCTIIRPHLSVPDSLGGKNLKGFARFRLRVHTLGTVLNSCLVTLNVGFEGSEPVNIFKDTTYMPCNSHLSPWNAETRRFFPWLEEYLARTQFRFCDLPNDPSATQRVHLMSFEIHFNPKIEELLGPHAYE